MRVDDLLSDVLTMVRLSGALIFRVDIRGPWCVSATPARKDFAPALPRGTHHLIAFHVVLEGQCWVRHLSEAWQPVHANEAVVVSHGARHDIGDHCSDSPMALASILGERRLLDVRKLCFETGTTPTTRILCGFLGCDSSAFAPLFAALPSTFIARFDAQTAALVNYAVTAASSERPGSNGLRIRMAELLFLEALRSFMRELPNDASGWLAGLGDPVVGRALHLLHADPAWPWAVETLARSAACSRSLLAQRFKAIIGQTPMQYLTRLRMQRAAQRLANSHCNVETVADEVGYASSAAFQRAFKRCHGQPPARWRHKPINSR